MKRRNPFAVFVLSLITLGIYDIYWLVVTKKELNEKTKIKTPTIWLLFAPIVILVVAAIVIFAMNGTSTTSSGSATTAGANVVVLLVDVIAVLVILPISFYWFFKFSKAVNEYTNGKMSTGVTFLLMWILHLIGVAIVQDAFNDMLDAGTAPAPAAAGPTQPATPEPVVSAPVPPAETAAPQSAPQPSAPAAPAESNPPAAAPETPPATEPGDQAPPAGPVVG